MALAPLSQTIFLTEDGSVPNSEKAVTIPPMGIAPSITLGNLTLSAPILTGTASNGTIVGSSDGSFIADTVPGLTIDSPARSYVWDGSGAAATYPTGLSETHPDATNSGRTSSVTVGAAIIKVTVTGTPPTTGQAGTAYTFAPTAANGAGTKVWTKNRTLLPGQTFSTTTGAIGGTPTQSGTLTDLVITVTDDTGSASTTATTVTIAAASANPTLGSVGLSGTLTEGVASSGTITGLTAGSSLTTSVAGLTFNRSGQTYAFTGSAPAGTGYTITETLGGAVGSPKASQIIVRAGATSAATQVTRNGASVTRGGVAVTRGSGSSSSSAVTFDGQAVGYADNQVTYGE